MRPCWTPLRPMALFAHAAIMCAFAPDVRDTRPWSTGMIPASQAGDPGSIPGGRILFTRASLRLAVNTNSLKIWGTGMQCIPLSSQFYRLPYHRHMRLVPGGSQPGFELSRRRLLAMDYEHPSRFPPHRAEPFDKAGPVDVR